MVLELCHFLAGYDSTNYKRLILNALWIMLNVPSIGPSMPFWGKLVELNNEVIVQLMKTKCFPVLYYGLEACPLRKSQFSSLSFVINSTFRKVFDTRSQDVVDVCLEMFNCVPAEQTVAMRKAKLLKRVNNIYNMLCQTFAVEAAKELATS